MLPHDVRLCRLLSIQQRLATLASGPGSIPVAAEDELQVILNSEPEILAAAIGRSHVDFVRRNVTFGSGPRRPDFILHCAGDNDIWVIEAKAPSYPVLSDGCKASLHLREAVLALGAYLAAAQSYHQRCDTRLLPMIVGMHRAALDTNEKIMAACRQVALEAGHELALKHLVVLTIEDLMRAASSTTQGAPEPSLDGSGRTLLARSASRRQLGTVVAEWSLAPPKAWKDLTVPLFNKWRHGVGGNILELLGSDEPEIQLQTELVLDALDRLGVPVAAAPSLISVGAGAAEKNIAAAYSANLTMLADLALYQTNGDLPIAKWTHGGTRFARDIIGNLPARGQALLIDGAARMFLRDDGHDAVSATTHVLRGLSDKDAISMVLRASEGQNPRWSGVPSMQSIDPVGFLHIHFMRATHGDAMSIALLNDTATNVALLAALSEWNMQHPTPAAAQELETTLRNQAESPRSHIRPIQTYTKAVYRHYMLRRYPL